ncbi:unnamed protein product [Pylaiella littoralis]
MMSSSKRWNVSKIMAAAAWALVAVVAGVPSVDAMFSSSSDVVQVDDKSFKDTVLKSDGVWLVEFYAPWCGHCKNLKSDWEKSASALKGVVGIAAVDATESKALASKYGIQGFPSIKVFGADKRNPTDYNGERTATAIVSGGMAAARDLVKSRQGGGAKKRPSNDKKRESKKPSPGSKKKKGSSGGSGTVVELNESNFKDMVLDSDEMWLVEFFAPWCGHCQKLAPEWESAAGQLSGSVNLGAVDATQAQSLAQKYGVQGYPTIKTFPAGPKKAPQDYNGPREAAGIVDYATGILERSGWVPKVPQLTGKDIIDEKCGGTKICVIAALPHILDSGKAGREEYIEKVKKAAKKSRNPYLNVIWSEGGAQSALEEATGLTFGYPAVIAVSVEKKAFAVHVGSFSVEGMSEFLTGLTTGSTRTKPLEELPKIVTVEPWDEKDAPAVEEEFSLEDLFGDDEGAPVKQEL